MRQYNLDNQLSEIFNQYGAFWAFGDKQFNEQKKEDIKYANMGAGLICPTDNADYLLAAMKKINSGKVAWELANNTKKEIIWYQLANHECQISNDWTDVIDLLGSYGITAEEIKAEWLSYCEHCVKNDLF